MKPVAIVLSLMFFLVEVARIYLNSQIIIQAGGNSPLLLFGVLGILTSILFVSAGVAALVSMNALNPTNFTLARILFGSAFSINAFRFLILNPGGQLILPVIGVFALIAAAYCFYTIPRKKV
jgi:hypothetical protein